MRLRIEAGLGTERGAITVLAVVVAAGLILVGAVALQATALVQLRHQAAAAADLAALAASRAVVAGDDGCAVARQIARDNGARVSRCRLDEAVATITVRLESKRWWGQTWRIEQRARAAPASYVAASYVAAGGASARRVSSRSTAPALSSGSLPLPHLGDCTHDGHPAGQGQSAMASRVVRSQVAATS